MISEVKVKSSRWTVWSEGVWVNEGMSELIPNLDTRCRWVVNSRPQLLHVRNKRTLFLFIWELGGTQIRSRCFGEAKPVFAPGVSWTTIPDFSNRILIRMTGRTVIFCTGTGNYVFTNWRQSIHRLITFWTTGELTFRIRIRCIAVMPGNRTQLIEMGRINPTDDHSYKFKNMNNMPVPSRFLWIEDFSDQIFYVIFQQMHYMM